MKYTISKIHIYRCLPPWWYITAFYKCNHAKYRKYADEWLNNLTDAQIEGFERQRIGQIDKSKCV